MEKVKCPHCNGTGKNLEIIGGKRRAKKPCPICHGKGYIIKGKRGLKEQAPTNSMGGSSSTAGPIQTFDPILTSTLKRNKLLQRWGGKK